jgi:hypothetical protein
MEREGKVVCKAHHELDEEPPAEVAAQDVDDGADGLDAVHNGVADREVAPLQHLQTPAGKEHIY